LPPPPDKMVGFHEATRLATLHNSAEQVPSASAPPPPGAMKFVAHNSTKSWNSRDGAAALLPVRPALPLRAWHGHHGGHGVGPLQAHRRRPRRGGLQEAEGARSHGFRSGARIPASRTQHFLPCTLSRTHAAHNIPPTAKDGFGSRAPISASRAQPAHVVPAVESCHCTLPLAARCTRGTAMEEAGQRQHLAPHLACLQLGPGHASLPLAVTFLSSQDTLARFPLQLPLTSLSPSTQISPGAPPALSPAARHPRADPAGSRRVGIGE
jgi:hypothetical protein